MEMERFNGRQKQKIKELWPWSQTWRRHLGESALLWFGPGQHTSASQRNVAGAVRLLCEPEACAVRRMCGGATPNHHGYLLHRMKQER